MKSVVICSRRFKSEIRELRRNLERSMLLFLSPSSLKSEELSEEYRSSLLSLTHDHFYKIRMWILSIITKTAILKQYDIGLFYVRKQISHLGQ